MTEPRPVYATSKTFSASAEPVRIVTPITLTEDDEINLIRRYRQAKSQGLRFLVDADSGELQMLGRCERLRHRIAY